MYFTKKVINGIHIIICSHIDIDRYIPNEYYSTFTEIEYASYIVDKFSIGNIQYVFFPKELTIKIITLSVNEEYRNNNIGKQLYTYAIKHAKQEGMKTIKLDCIGAPSDEHNLYIKMGLQYIDKYSGPEMVGTIL